MSSSPVTVTVFENDLVPSYTIIVLSFRNPYLESTLNSMFIRYTDTDTVQIQLTVDIITFSANHSPMHQWPPNTCWPDIFQLADCWHDRGMDDGVSMVWVFKANSVAGVVRCFSIAVRVRAFHHPEILPTTAMWLEVKDGEQQAEDCSGQNTS